MNSRRKRNSHSMSAKADCFILYKHAFCMVYEANEVYEKRKNKYSYKKEYHKCGIPFPFYCYLISGKICLNSGVPARAINS